MALDDRARPLLAQNPFTVSPELLKDIPVARVVYEGTYWASTMGPR
jgi:hypothetical protein